MGFRRTDKIIWSSLTFKNNVLQIFDNARILEAWDGTRGLCFFCAFCKVFLSPIHVWRYEAIRVRKYLLLNSNLGSRNRTNRKTWPYNRGRIHDERVSHSPGEVKARDSYSWLWSLSWLEVALYPEYPCYKIKTDCLMESKAITAGSGQNVVTMETNTFCPPFYPWAMTCPPFVDRDSGKQRDKKKEPNGDNRWVEEKVFADGKMANRFLDMLRQQGYWKPFFSRLDSPPTSSSPPTQTQCEVCIFVSKAATVPKVSKQIQLPTYTQAIVGFSFLVQPTTTYTRLAILWKIKMQIPWD